MARAKRPTEEEYQYRVDLFALMLLEGERPGEITQYGIREWGIAGPTAKKYLHRAQAQIKEEVDDLAPYVLSEHLAARRLIRRELIKEGKYKDALAALTDEAKLLGLYPAEKREFSGPGGGPIVTREYAALSDDQLQERINELLGRADQGPAGGTGQAAGRERTAPARIRTKKTTGSQGPGGGSDPGPGG